MGWARVPVIRFLVIGVLLFAGHRWWGWNTNDVAAEPRGEVVISAVQLEQLRDQYRRDTGLPLTADAETALVRRAVDEELLYREALARGLQRNDRSIEWQLAERMHFFDGDDDDAMGARRTELANAAFDIGLDRGDTIIRRMLIEKMRMLAIYQATQAAPVDTDLQRHLDRHAELYRQPERFSFWHVFLARERRSETLERDAETLLEALRQAHTQPAAAADRGDAFAIAPHVVEQSVIQLRALFGPAFAAAVQQSEAARWVGPIASAFGLHLIWVEDHLPAQMPAMDRVRGQIVRRLRAEQREAIVRSFIAQLEHAYTVRIEAGAGGSS